jgi:hypothetical protein
LLKNLTSAQLTEWEAYDRIDPVGKWRDELGFASLSSLIVNMARQILHDPKKGKPEYVTPEDFMPKWGEAPLQKPEPKKQSAEEMLRILKGIARVQGTTDKIKKT